MHSDRHDFALSGKALLTQTDDDGTLYIEGLAATWEVDREGEAFDRKAFDRGLDTFLNGTGTLAFHHQHDKVLGRVLQAKVLPEGLWIRARVDPQGESSPLRYIYDGIRRGTLRGLSAAGFFKRAMVGGLQKIVDVDFTEVSITGVPVGRGTTFALASAKALADLEDEFVREATRELDLIELRLSAYEARRLATRARLALL